MLVKWRQKQHNGGVGQQPKRGHSYIYSSTSQSVDGISKLLFFEPKNTMRIVAEHLLFFLFGFLFLPVDPPTCDTNHPHRRLYCARRAQPPLDFLPGRLEVGHRLHRAKNARLSGAMAAKTRGSSTTFWPRCAVLHTASQLPTLSSRKFGDCRGNSDARPRDGSAQAKILYPRYLSCYSDASTGQATNLRGEWRRTLTGVFVQEESARAGRV